MNGSIKTRWLLLAGVLALLAGLVLKAPAAWLIAQAMPENAPVRLLGVSGEVRGGRIQTIELAQLRPPKQLGPARWQLKPLSLLWLHPSLTLDISAPVLARGQLRLSPLGSAHFNDWRATGDLTELAALAGYSFLPIKGQIGLAIEHLDIAGPLPESVAGTADLLGLQWQLGRQTLDLGDVHADLATVEAEQVATLSAPRGPLDLEGTARIDAEGRYDVNLRVKPKADAPPQLVNLLRGLGRPDAQAWYTLRYRGQLPVAR